MIYQIAAAEGGRAASLSRSLLKLYPPRSCSSSIRSQLQRRVEQLDSDVELQKANVRNEEERVKMEKDRHNERVKSLESQLERCMEESSALEEYKVLALLLCVCVFFYARYGERGGRVVGGRGGVGEAAESSALEEE